MCDTEFLRRSQQFITTVASLEVMPCYRCCWCCSCHRKCQTECHFSEFCDGQCGQGSKANVTETKSLRAEPWTRKGAAMSQLYKNIFLTKEFLWFFLSLICWNWNILLELGWDIKLVTLPFRLPKSKYVKSRTKQKWCPVVYGIWLLK